jgi:hypothetical protein
VEQRRFGGGLRVVLVLAVALAAGPDDPPVLVTTDVDLALAAGERAGGELLDQTLIMRAQALYLGVVGVRGMFVWVVTCGDGVG